MDIRYEGKRALVTGAAGAFGKATTDILTRGGATVIAADVRAEDLAKAHDGNPNVVQVVCDLTDWDATSAMVKKHLPIDLLVNNAGVFLVRAIGEIDQEHIDNQFDINLKAILNITQVVSNDLIARKAPGSIVNLSSIASNTAAQYSAMYAASKAAISSITKSMALELGKHGIRVNAVRPGAVDTHLIIEFKKAMPDLAQSILQRTPTGRLSNPDDIASAICFLLSDFAGNINGSEVTVDGGFTIHCE